MAMPAWLLKAMVFPSPSFRPPQILFAALSIMTPQLSFGRGDVPSACVPIRFRWNTFRIGAEGERRVQMPWF